MTIVTWKRALFLFDGRLSIAQFWKYSFINAIFAAVVMSVLNIFLGAQMVILPSLVVSAIFIWASLAIIIKRLHDLNRRSIRLLFYLIPVIGPIWCIIECGCMGGGIRSVNPNKFGPPPEVPLANWPRAWKKQWPEFVS